jgi:hypothetical protein
MTLPTRQQPGFRFPDQTNIASCLFDFILETPHNREELERSWEAIARDIEIQDQRESLQR